MVGDLTIAVEDELNVVLVAPTTAGIVESSPGAYTGRVIAPVVVAKREDLIVVWYSAVHDESSTDNLTVRLGAMPSEGLWYATPDDVRDWLTLPDLTDEQLIPVIRKCQIDIDAGAGSWEPYADTALKFASDVTPDVLSSLQAKLLTRATCQQVEYRMTVGEDFMVKEQYESESGPDGSVSGKVKKLSAYAYASLASASLLRLNTGHVEKHHYGRNRRRLLPSA